VLNVPEHVKSGGKRAKGVGVAAPEADVPAVYKSCFAMTDDYQKALRKLGVKRGCWPGACNEEHA
jgi:hypothetical protein